MIIVEDLLSICRLCETARGFSSLVSSSQVYLPLSDWVTLTMTRSVPTRLTRSSFFTCMATAPTPGHRQVTSNTLVWKENMLMLQDLYSMAVWDIYWQSVWCKLHACSEHSCSMLPYENNWAKIGHLENINILSRS